MADEFSTEQFQRLSNFQYFQQDQPSPPLDVEAPITPGKHKDEERGTPFEESQHMSSQDRTCDGTDSGYATGTTTTPARESAKSSQAELELSTGNFLRRRTTKLKVFDRTIPSYVSSRFLDLNELYEKPLCEYLIKKRVRPCNISIKLKVLGESEAAVEYWYVHFMMGIFR